MTTTKDLSGAALLSQFLYFFVQSCSDRYGGVADAGFRDKCDELLERFFHPQYPEFRFDEVALRRKMLAHPLLWNMPDVNKRNYAAQSHVTGNRLSLDEKLHLPLRSNVMLPHEFAVAIDYFKSLSINGVRLFLMFLTAKPIGYLSELVVSTVALKLDMGDYIDISRGVWARRPVHTPKAFEPTPQQQEFLYAHRGFVELPLPKVLVTLLQKQMKKSNLLVAKLDELIPNFNVAQSLNVDNGQRSFSEAVICSGLFTHLVKHLRYFLENIVLYLFTS